MFAVQPVVIGGACIIYHNNITTQLHYSSYVHTCQDTVITILVVVGTTLALTIIGFGPMHECMHNKQLNQCKYVQCFNHFKCTVCSYICTYMQYMYVPLYIK